MNTAAATGSASCRFAHYFVVCGVDTETGLEPDDGAGRWYLRTKRHTRQYTDTQHVMLDDSISQVIYLVIHIGLFVLPNCVSVCVGRGDSHLNMIFLLPVSALNNMCEQTVQNILKYMKNVINIRLYLGRICTCLWACSISWMWKQRQMMCIVSFPNQS